MVIIKILEKSAQMVNLQIFLKRSVHLLEETVRNIRRKSEMMGIEIMEMGVILLEK